ncbi:hypothetical protein SAMN04487939_10299 [Lysobacter sp. yr284]|uniref:hypothetical protein n=1 Tax=Lysobacter sp. yr284 TaxID=1761791 RepID=UPI00089422D5|nr:hypothetical protein [Lysobacter sp. yr284]SDY42838.1 hypothetical protein SAMN04487939_10299 [Lysobacter sp. yr284]
MSAAPARAAPPRPYDPDWPMPFAATRVRTMTRDERRRLIGARRLPGPSARWPRRGRPPWLRTALWRCAFGLPSLALAIWAVGRLFGGAPLWLLPPSLAGFALALGWDAAEQARRDARGWRDYWRQSRRELGADLRRGEVVERRYRFLDCKVFRVRDRVIDLMYVFKLDERHCYVRYHSRPEHVAEGAWLPPTPRREWLEAYPPRGVAALDARYHGEAFERAPLGWVRTLDREPPAPFGVWEAAWDEVERRVGCTLEDPEPAPR